MLFDFQISKRLKAIAGVLLVYLILTAAYFVSRTSEYFPSKVPYFKLFCSHDLTSICCLQIHFQNSSLLDFEGRDITIVFWTKYFGTDKFITDYSKDFTFNEATNAEEMFNRCPQPANRCRLTTNRSLIQQSEAVIFHIRDLEGISWPEFRSPEQRWIFWNLESPLHTRNPQLLKNLPPHLHFNWTLSYRYSFTPSGLYNKIIIFPLFY